MNPAKKLPNPVAVITGAVAAVLVAGCVYSEGGYVGSYGGGYAATGGGGYVEISSDNDFYEPLGAYGQWEVVGDYGRCWVPGGVGSDWQPYENGEWVSTDDGWYWESDEPWGWATYHYGRWAFAAGLGWCWIPGTQWAPAWVSWWEGDGCIGWAPLGPRDRFEHGRFEGQRPRDRDCVFVEERRFTERIGPGIAVRNRPTLIERSTSITNVRVVNNITVNAGPRRENIERASGRNVRTVPASDVRREREAPVLQHWRTTTGAHPAPQGGRPAGERAVAPAVSHPVAPAVSHPVAPATTVPPANTHRETTPVHQRPPTTAPATEVNPPTEHSRPPVTEEHRTVTPRTEERRTVTPPPGGSPPSVRVPPTRPAEQTAAPTHVSQPGTAHGGPKVQSGPTGGGPKGPPAPKGGEHTEEKGDKGDKPRQQQAN